MSNSNNFWGVFATYMQEIAPVVGPLCSSIGDTAAAVDRAGRSSTQLPAAKRTVLVSSTTVTPRKRRTKRIKPSTDA